MADQRSVMKEYRLLEQKRQSGPLTPQEEARLAQLRDLVGPETGVGASKPGFDVNAAAARLRESLLPAGLRNRPPSMEAPPPPEPQPQPEAAPGETGLEAVWNAAPFAPLSEPPALAEDSLFDPGTLGEDAPATEGAWDPNAQPYDAAAQGWDPSAAAYDPNAQPYDPNAAAYDPNAQPYDPNAAAYDPNAQPYDPNAAVYDPNARPYDPNAAAYDPDAQPYDPNAAAYDPNAQPYDPNAAVYDPDAQPYDPNAAVYDPDAQPYDPNAAAYDPNAQPQWDAATQAAWDPSLAAPWGGEAPAEQAAEPLTEAEALEPVESVEPAEGGWDVGAELAPAEPEPEPGPDGGLAGAVLDWDPGAVSTGGEEPPAQPEPSAWEASAIEPETAAEPAWDADLAEPEPLAEAGLEPSLEPPVDASLDAGWVEPEAAPEPSLPEPPAEAEAEPLLVEQPPEELLPFDSGAPSAAAPGEGPAGWGADSAPPSEDVPFEDDVLEPSHEPAAPGSYGDLSPEQHTQVDALPAEAAQDLLAPLGAGQELTSDDDAFAQGFQLESNGSFGKALTAPAPAWDAGEPPGADGEPWESGQAMDLAMAPASAPPLDLGPPPAEEPLDELDVEDFPIVEGADLLEEIPPAPPPATRPPAPAAAVTRVEGAQRVVVHTMEGLVKRGVITDATLDAGTLALAQQPDGTPEQLATASVKAIFFMLAAGEKAPEPVGKKVRVTFIDGRQIAGFSPDYTDAGAGFFMIPADTRTNTGRIWVYRSAVKTVSVS